MMGELEAAIERMMRVWRLWCEHYGKSTESDGPLLWRLTEYQCGIDKCPPGTWMAALGHLRGGPMQELSYSELGLGVGPVAACDALVSKILDQLHSAEMDQRERAQKLQATIEKLLAAKATP